MEKNFSIKHLKSQVQIRDKVIYFYSYLYAIVINYTCCKILKSNANLLDGGSVEELEQLNSMVTIMSRHFAFVAS